MNKAFMVVIFTIAHIFAGCWLPKSVKKTLERWDKYQIWYRLFCVILLWHLVDIISDELLYHTYSELKKRSDSLLLQSLGFCVKFSTWFTINIIFYTRWVHKKTIRSEINICFSNSNLFFLILSSRLVLNVVFLLLGDSPASECYVSTFRYNLSPPSHTAYEDGTDSVFHEVGT